MVESAMIIIGCYLLGALTVHAIHQWMPRSRGNVKHYVFVTNNNQQHIEWYMRAVTLFAWLRGKELRISVVDQLSTDQTLLIVKRMQRDGDVHVLHSRNWYETEQFVKGLKNNATINAANTVTGNAGLAGSLGGRRQIVREEEVTVVYVGRDQDKSKVPLIH